MNKNVLIAAMVSLINGLSFAVIIPILYSYAVEYGLNDFGAGMLLTTFTLFQFLATPMLGAMSDKWGRKPVLSVSLFGTFLSSVLTAFAPSAAFLFLARALDGITGGNNSVAKSVIIDSTSEEERTKGLAMFGASFGIAFLLGPVISLLLLNFLPESVAMRAIYLFSGGFALIGFLVSTFVLPETNTAKDKDLNIAKKALSLQVIKGFRMPSINVLFVTTFISAIAFGMFIFAIQPYIINTLGKTSKEISLLLILVGVVSIPAVILVKKLEQKFGQIRLMLVMSVGWIVSFLILPLYPNYIYFMIANIPLIFVNNVITPLIGSILSAKSHPKSQGEITGINESYVNLGQAIGPLLAGLIAQVWVGWYPGIFFGAALMCAGLSVYLFLMRDKLKEKVLVKL